MGDKIVEIGSGRPTSDFVDLGDVALLPGLINAHTHLEFSDCRQPIGQPGTSLPQWIGQVIATRRDASAESKRQAVAAGLDESWRAGVRLIGEISTPPCDYSRCGTHEDMDIVTFAEVLGLADERGDERIAAAETQFRNAPNAAFSPHAPYSTSLRVIDWCVSRSRATNRPLAMHVAESPAERELLMTGNGPFADKFRQLGVWRDGHFPWGANPFSQLIERLAPASSVLLIHGNDLRQDEIDLLGQSSQFTVVYCPRTHAFFGYDPHPVAELWRAGVRVALGTDSRASNPDLHLWREAQFLWKHRPDLSPDQVLVAATIGGAESLGRSDLGRLDVGCRPGLGTVETSAKDSQGLFRDLSEQEYTPLNREREH